MQIYNPLTRRKEEFIPLTPGQVGLYVCGVTPYDYSHVGHARCYVVFDVIRRWLEFSGCQVTHVQNFTDIDDKIIARSQQEGVAWHELARRFSVAYFEDMERLGVLPAHHYPRATEHIQEMIEVIGCLFKQGLAYQVDGD